MYMEVSSFDRFLAISKVPHHILTFLEAANFKGPRASFSGFKINHFGAIKLLGIFDTKFRHPFPFSCSLVPV